MTTVNECKTLIFIIERTEHIMKDTIKNLLALVGAGFIIYKAYEYLTKEPAYEEFADNEDGVEFDAEAQAEESLASKIKSAAKKVVG
jgi:hypothetical protein